MKENVRGKDDDRKMLECNASNQSTAYSVNCKSLGKVTYSGKRQNWEGKQNSDQENNFKDKNSIGRTNRIKV